MEKTADLFIRAQHADLLKKLNAWDVAYHQNDAPIVDDATYDDVKSKCDTSDSIDPSAINPQ